MSYNVISFFLEYNETWSSYEQLLNWRSNVYKTLVLKLVIYLRVHIIKSLLKHYGKKVHIIINIEKKRGTIVLKHKTNKTESSPHWNIINLKRDSPPIKKTGIKTHLISSHLSVCILWKLYTYQSSISLHCTNNFS